MQIGTKNIIFQIYLEAQFAQKEIILYTLVLIIFMILFNLVSLIVYFFWVESFNQILTHFYQIDFEPHSVEFLVYF